MPEPMGFFTDTTVCIGCKACEVACKEWNELPGTNGGAQHAERRQLRQHAPARRLNWRHVKFIEQFTRGPRRTAAG